MIYFAYGSNMCSDWLKEHPKKRVTPEFRGIGFIQGWKLNFEKPSSDDSGKANVVPAKDPNARVWGVLYEITDPEQWKRLVASEGGYDEKWVDVVIKGKMEQAKTFIADPKTAKPDLQPYDWYLRLVVDGARASHIDTAAQEYFKMIEATPAMEDSKPDRETKILAEKCNC